MASPAPSADPSYGCTRVVKYGAVSEAETTRMLATAPFSASVIAASRSAVMVASWGPASG